MNFRARHRAASHDSAHADDSDHAKAPQVDHPLAPRGHAKLITTTDALNELLTHLKSTGQFAYDSEFIGELTYVPKLCLIQVATTHQIALIDPLADLDLKPFWELICDPAIEKIVHAGQQDLEPVIRHTGRAPCNVFDTQIVAGFCAMAYPVSLSRLVMELIGAKLGKGLTFTHWDQRPLSASQLRYAADDVRFLPAVRDELGRRLKASGHEPSAKEECASLCDPSGYGFDPDRQYLRIRGASSLDPRKLAVLRELTILRDAVAREHNVPPRAMLRDEVLIDLARSPVKSVEKLASVRGLPRPVEAAHGSQIVEATARGLAAELDNIEAPRENDESPTQRFTADALWAAVQCMAAAQDIDPDLVTSRQELGEFFRLIATSDSELDAHPLLQGWRGAAIGKSAVQWIRDGGPMHFQWRDGQLKL